MYGESPGVWKICGTPIWWERSYRLYYPVTELPTLLSQYRLWVTVEVGASSRFVNDIKCRRRVPKLNRLALTH